jgi:3-deoxy-manno-octulosonate cytidylyltransferase (CMP-KDO synthetase)
MLQGKTIIQHVYDRVLDSNIFKDVIIATDDVRIANEIIGFEGKFKMTSPNHPSGSDRIAEIIEKMDCNVVFNIQGDEPMIDKKTLADLVNAFRDATVQAASLMTPITNQEDLLNPNVVKVVTDINDNALYFSRSLIPFDRDANQKPEYYRHIGVYAYRKQTLLDYIKLPQSILEKIEKLEQLRFLENGIPIRMVKTAYQGMGIDTPEDLIKVENLLSKE